MAGVTGELLARHFGGRFVWGRRDCCISACNAFAELWGIDPMAQMRGRYRDRRSARETLAAAGGLVCVAVELARESGLRWRYADFARAGDLALLPVGGKMALGLAIGDGTFAAKGWWGLAVVDRAEGCWGMP